MTARAYAACAAPIAWLGVLLQAYLSVRAAVDAGRTLVDGMVIYLGFFTVTTNLLVCAALTSASLARGVCAERFLRRLPTVAGIATSIAFVALAYHFLLRHIWNPQGMQWLADVLLHYVTPLLFVIYWYVTQRSGALRWTHTLWWSLYPVLYFVYVLVRGEIIGTYPYFFIDVAALGYQRALLNAAGLLIFFIALGLGVVLLNRLVPEVA